MHTGLYWEELRENKQLYNLVEQKSNGKIFCFKNRFLSFSETKKFSTESVLTFRELQPLVSYKRVSYEKNTCITVNEKNMKLIKKKTNFKFSNAIHWFQTMQQNLEISKW